MTKKASNATEAYYSNHLFGDNGRFARDPNKNRQARIERMYIRVLTELACNRFKWTGFPDTIDTRYLELELFYKALAGFFYDGSINQYQAMAAAPSGVINQTQNPTELLIYGPSFGSKRLSTLEVTTRQGNTKRPEVVPIWANYLRMPDLDIVAIYASKLANIDTTIEINMRNARRSRVAFVDENSVLSAENFNRQIDEGNPVIKIGANSDIQPVALDLGVSPDTIEKLSIVRARLWSECMGLLGIDNSNQDKKERLVADEVDANKDQVNSMKMVNLNARRIACKQIVEVFGINVSVDYNSDISTEVTFSEAIDYADVIEDEDEDEDTKELES